MLELVAKRGRALLEARGALIWLRDGEELVAYACAGDIDEDLLGTRKGIVGCVPGQVVTTRLPMRLTRRRPLPDIPPVGSGAEDAGSALLVPMISRGHAVGVLIAFDSTGDTDEFSEEDEQLLLTFAASAANAVALAQSVESDRLRGALAATEAERGRWARELHDETLQRLAGLRLQLAATLSDDQNLQGTRSAVSDAVADLGAEIEGLRAIISDLRPPALDELGLLAATESLVDRYRDRDRDQHRIECHLQMLSTEERGRLLDSSFESTVYRLVQEALTNASKHSHADSVHLAIRESTDRITVDIQDDGCGFDTSSNGEGFGLIGMRERVSLAGGTLKVTSGSGGTRVLACMPLPPSDGHV